MNKLSKEKYFNYDSKELLVVMRFDFYDGRLSNQWNPSELIIELNNRREIDLRKLQQELNYIQFELIDNFNNIVSLCNGTGYDNETLLYVDLELSKYVIKLIPVRDSYSYIYTYLKEVKQLNLLLVLKIISVVLDMISSGLSEAQAVSKASAMFGVSKDFIRKFL